MNLESGSFENLVFISAFSNSRIPELLKDESN